MYDRSFYAGHRPGSSGSASILVPLLLDLYRPKSVIDVGCGVGTWLAAFKENGVEDIFGLDGVHVAADQLLIPPDCFRATDLCRPIEIGRRFDLAVSLEVAEHLPESQAERFVRDLIALAPVVLFSAAIKGQGGTGHLNERFQSYWAEKFAASSYITIDCLRPKVWSREDVSFWYAQNTIVYAAASRLADFPTLQAAADQHGMLSLDVVHPRQLMHTHSLTLGSRVQRKFGKFGKFLEKRHF